MIGEGATVDRLGRLFRAGFDELQRDGDVVVLQNTRLPRGVGVFHD